MFSNKRKDPNIIEDNIKICNLLGVQAKPLSTEKQLGFVSKKLVAPYEYTGIELEIEQFNDPDPVALGNHWRIEQDYSLRNEGAYEIKHKYPQHGARLLRTLDKLGAYVGDSGTFTERCGLHIHLDVRSLTLAEFKLLILLYLTFERTLYRYIPPERETNGYCVPIYLTETEIELIAKGIFLNYKNFMYDAPQIMNTIGKCGKYSGLNFSSVSMFGSLEFRMHEGTRSKHDILNWINIIHSMIKFARIYGTGRNVNNYLKTATKYGLYNLFKKVFVKHADLLYYDNIEEDIMKGLILSAELTNYYTLSTGILEIEL